ncbi:MAG TPA: protein adenylyltransferase SelO family protein, partial [Vampirovibrionales bacterium]
MGLKFDNRFATLPECFYTKMNPEVVSTKPELVHINSSLAETLGLEISNKEELAYCFAGNKLFKDSEPLAMVYSGHQFGYWAGQLGDGRALLLGQVLNKKQKLLDIQLKGAGQTPYSRMGDGRAVMRSSIREYLCSEAMHALQIPTSRALCLVKTNQTVYREMP